MVQARDAALFTLLYGCGLRIAEALALDVARRPRSADAAAAGAAARATSSGIVPVLPVVREAIGRLAALTTRGRRPAAPLFLGVRGGRLDPAVAQRDLRQFRRLAGLPEHATPHALRHSFATHLLGRRRRSALHPGTARPCQPVHDPALHRGGHRPADGGLAHEPSARDPRARMSEDIETARDGMERATEAHERGEVPHARRAALVIAVLAAALAIAENGAKDAQTATLTDHIAASDVWAEYQAKSVRRSVFAQTADLLSALPNAADPAVAARVAHAKQEAARMQSEPAGKGMEQLAAEAHALERSRETHEHRYEGLEKAGGALQLAIVLVTVSVVTATRALMWGGAILGLLAALFGIATALAVI